LNALGMTRNACATALAHYLGQVRRLADTLARRSSQESHAHENDLLQKLQFHVEVDVQSQASADGHERLSEIESHVFEPALRRIRDRVAGIAAVRVPAQRIPAIVELEREIAIAISAISRWQRAPG
jgi:hypothetical protein